MIPTQTQQQGWWLVQDTNGAIGLIQGGPPSNAITSIFVGTAANATDLQDNYPGSLGAAEAKLEKLKGVSQSQIGTLIHQIDSGAGLSPGLSWLYIGSDADKNAVSSNVSTQYGSEAQGTSLIPGTSGIVNDLSGIDLSGIWSWLTTPANWLRILEYVGGAALVLIAIRGFAG